MNLESCCDNLLVYAKEGDPEAQFKLGDFYRLKNGVGSIAVAAEWFLKAAIQDYAPAQMALALLYLDGLEPEDYERNARYWLQKAAQSDCKESSKLLHELNSADEKLEGVVLLAEADMGNPQAQFECGMMLILGMGLRQDVAAGVNLLVEAAMGGHAKARAEMESCYFFGENPVSTGTREWLALSARQDDPSAFDYYLAYFFHMGILVERNGAMAATHLSRAAELGNRDAQFLLLFSPPFSHHDN